jgi:hypothetical protein
MWSRGSGSNRRPTAYKAVALPLSYTGGYEALDLHRCSSKGRLRFRTPLSEQPPHYTPLAITTSRQASSMTGEMGRFPSRKVATRAARIRTPRSARSGGQPRAAVHETGSPRAGHPRFGWLGQLWSILWHSGPCKGLGKVAALCALSSEDGVRSAAMRWLALPLAALIKASMSFVEINRRRLRLDQHGSSGAPRLAGGLSPQVIRPWRRCRRPGDRALHPDLGYRRFQPVAPTAAHIHGGHDRAGSPRDIR